jgi:hypothetical protein
MTLPLMSPKTTTTSMQKSKDHKLSRGKRATVVTTILVLVVLLLSWWIATRPASADLGVDKALETMWQSLAVGQTTQSAVPVSRGDVVVLVGPYTNRTALESILPPEQHGAIATLLSYVNDYKPFVAVLDRGRVVTVDTTFVYSGGYSAGCVLWPVVNRNIIIEVKKVSLGNHDDLIFIERNGVKVEDG